jgi:hypothetical protein
VALFIFQEKMRSAVGVKIKNCPCLSASVVESNAIAEFGYKKQAVAFCFRIVEAKIHAAIIGHPHAAAFIACSIVKDNSRARAVPLLGLSLLDWVWHWRA